MDGMEFVVWNLWNLWCAARRVDAPRGQVVWNLWFAARRVDAPRAQLKGKTCKADQPSILYSVGLLCWFCFERGARRVDATRGAIHKLKNLEATQRSI